MIKCVCDNPNCQTELIVGLNGWITMEWAPKVKDSGVRSMHMDANGLAEAIRQLRAAYLSMLEEKP